MGNRTGRGGRKGLTIPIWEGEAVPSPEKVFDKEKISLREALDTKVGEKTRIVSYFKGGGLLQKFV